MATHFKGPILYSAARKGLENLQVGVWPDQAVFLDDFTGIVIDATNDWTVVKDSGATVAIAADTATGVMALRFKVMKYFNCPRLLEKNSFLKPAFLLLVPLVVVWDKWMFG